MQNEDGDVMELPSDCTVKVHSLMCLEIQRIIDAVSQIIPAIEYARPRNSGIQALCSLQVAMEKAKLLIRHCSESSKLYLAITGDKIVFQYERIRDSFDSCLSQIENMVPSLLAAEISRIVDDLRAVTFTVESSEDEAGKVVLALLRQDIASSRSVNMLELKAVQIAALRLHITSPMALLIEKSSIKTLLEKIRDTDPTKKKILNYLLYLLKKYGKSIGRNQAGTIMTRREESLGKSIKLEQKVEKASEEPPEEFICPLSKRLMYDPVMMSNGQTFERVWIENWFNEGNETCPKTRGKLLNLSLATNLAIKDLILRWCLKHGITIPDPRSQLTSSSLCLQKFPSSSSIASYTSSIEKLCLQVSNVSIRYSDTSYHSF